MKYKNQPVKTIQVLFWGESDLLCEFKGPLDIWKRKSPVALPHDLPEWMEVLGKELFIQPKGEENESKGEENESKGEEEKPCQENQRGGHRADQRNP